MLKSIVSAFMAIITFFGTWGAALMNPVAPEDNSDFVPVLRFMVASDTHVLAANDEKTWRKLEK